MDSHPSASPKNSVHPFFDEAEVWTSSKQIEMIFFPSKQDPRHAPTNRLNFIETSWCGSNTFDAAAAAGDEPNSIHPSYTIVTDTDRHSCFPTIPRYLCLHFHFTDIFSRVYWVDRFRSNALYLFLLWRWIDILCWSYAFFYTLGYSWVSILQVWATRSSSFVSDH